MILNLIEDEARTTCILFAVQGNILEQFKRELSDSEKEFVAQVIAMSHGVDKIIAEDGIEFTISFLQERLRKLRLAA